MKRKTLIGLLIGFIVIQFIPVDFTNPPVNEQLDIITITQPSKEVSTLLKNACYDCHSNETVLPWYSKIAPVNFWLKGHINEGREHVNFSEWGNYLPKQAKLKAKESAEKVEEGEMPLKSYTWMHAEAKLNSAQKDSLVNFFQSLRN